MSGGETEAALKRGGYVYMDAMRALAAGLVVLNHIRDLALSPIPAGAGVGWKFLYFLAGFGHQAVMVFFVLSGFWITRAVVRREPSTEFWRDYLIDRLSRLEIVLAPALLLGAACDWVGTQILAAPLYSGATGALSMPRDIASALSLRAFGANLAFLQTVVAPPFGSNGPLWSLAYEFWYYLWFPALWLLVRGRWSWALATLAMAIAAPHIAWAFPCWLSGSALYFTLATSRARQLVGDGRWGWALLAGGAMIFAACATHARLHADGILGDWATSASFALLLLGLCIAAPPYPRLARPIAAFGAQSSYSLYVVHYPLIACFVAALLPGLRMAPGWESLGLVVLLYAAAVLAGWLFSRLTERNTGRLRDLLRARLPGPARRSPAAS